MSIYTKSYKLSIPPQIKSSDTSFPTATYANSYQINSFSTLTSPCPHPLQFLSLILSNCRLDKRHEKKQQTIFSRKTKAKVLNEKKRISIYCVWMKEAAAESLIVSLES